MLITIQFFSFLNLCCFQLIQLPANLQYVNCKKNTISFCFFLSLLFSIDTLTCIPLVCKSKENKYKVFVCTHNFSFIFISLRKQGHDFVYHEKSNPKMISCNTFNPSKHNGGSRDRKGPMARVRSD